MTQLYRTTFTATDGTEQFSRIFQTLRAARNWKKFWDAQNISGPITIWKGEPGGVRIAEGTTAKEDDMEYYMCVGSVRGSCGVHHRTLEAAERHCEADGRAVRRGSGYRPGSLTVPYSDRAPRRGIGTARNQVPIK